jgi:hypothetical protein
MPLPLLIPLIASAAGALFGGGLKKKATQTTAPTLDPAYGPLQQRVLQLAQQRLAGSSLPAGYETGGIKSINSAYDLVHQNLANSLTGRGLATSPVAGAAETAFSGARAGDVGTFRANLPLVERQLQTEDLGLATNLLGQGRGATTTTTAGGGLAGGFENLSGLLGYLMATGAFKAPGGGNGLPGFSKGPF